MPTLIAKPRFILVTHSDDLGWHITSNQQGKMFIQNLNRIVRWFGHVERMDEYRMAKRVLMDEVSGGRVRGRQRLGWMDRVKDALGNRGMTVEAARQCAKDRKEWRALVHM